MNVFDAAINRFEIIFNSFDNIYISCSGGKDSSVLIQLANKVASRWGKKFDMMFFDQEAISKYTVKHIDELKKLSAIRDIYHICLPCEEDNACSHLAPSWVMWDRNVEKKWVRPMPTTPDIINIDNCPFPRFKPGISCDYDVYAMFSDWYQKKHGGKIANVVGIRANESLDRRVSINSRYVDTWNSYRWSIHQSETVSGNDQIYRFFPLMDWTTADIWKCVHQEGFSQNELYEFMYKSGMNLQDMRICQPFGVEQRKGLLMWQLTEPENWDKVVDRVSGADFGALYSRTKLLGHLKTNKPSHMTNEEFVCFLIESLSLTSKDIALWYMEKILVTLRYHKRQYGQDITDWTVNPGKEYISWQFIAQVIEKNDFWCKKLFFTESNKGYALLEKIKQEIDIDIGDIKTKNKLK